MKFVLCFLSIYGLVHAYAFLKLRRALALKAWPALVLGLAFLLLMAGPISIHLLEHGGRDAAARLLGPPVFIWMAVLFWFCSLQLAADLWNLLILPLAKIHPAFRRARLPARVTLAASSVLTLAALAAGMIEASRLRVEKVAIATSKLPPGSPPIRILFISDVHLDVYRGDGIFQQLVQAVRELQPDMILSAGDLVDASMAHIRERAAIMAQWRPPLGQFAVLGNHEYYAGLDHSLAFHRGAGFAVLREGHAEPHPGLQILGVDDPAGGYTGQPSFSDERTLLAQRDSTRFAILLKHQPLLRPGAQGLFDLQLSGHTHGGQIFPFHLLVPILYPLPSGLSDAGGQRMYVSRGAGTWGPPLRLFAPPEITLITLAPE